MSLQLRDNLYWCACADRIVFLDVTSDRYFCLPRAANDAFKRLAAGQPDAQDAEPLRMLTERELLVEGGSLTPFRQPAAIQTPVCDIVQHPGPRSSAAGILRALAWEVRMAWQLKTQPFSEVIATAARRCTNAPPTRFTDARAIQSIAAAADAIAFFTRAHNRCLIRALAVHAACGIQGIRAKLVLGVIAHPFAAHSWVQLGDAVLVGGYEHARLHTPILVIE
jgi:hypothetical protein